MAVQYTAKATRLTDPDGTGPNAARTPNPGEPAADFNDLDTAVAAVVALANANETAVAGKADATHTHAATDITTGLLSPARLGLGTASSTTYLRGDGNWAAVSGVQGAAGRGFNPRGAWATGVAYAVDDIVTSDNSTFRVKTAHTSGGVAPTALTPGANYEVWSARGTGVLALPTGTAIPAGTPDGTVVFFY